MTTDTALMNLRRKLRDARREAPEMVPVYITRICKARAAGLAGMFIQAVTLCEIVEAGANADAITLARNMRQTIMTLLNTAAR